MIIAKFSNVKYYRGGSKVPSRLRFNQNITIFLPNYCKDWTNEDIINNLMSLSNNKIAPSQTTKILEKKISK